MQKPRYLAILTIGPGTYMRVDTDWLVRRMKKGVEQHQKMAFEISLGKPVRYGFDEAEPDR